MKIAYCIMGVIWLAAMIGGSFRSDQAADGQ